MPGFPPRNSATLMIRDNAWIIYDRAASPEQPLIMIEVTEHTIGQIVAQMRNPPIEGALVMPGIVDP